MHRLILAISLVLPAFAFAAGGDDDKPPKSTKTTAECTDGQVYDENTGKCAAPKESSLTDDELYEAVREFAYAGQLEDAMGALDAMSDQQSDRVLTYRGFVTRQMGDFEAGMSYYRAALAKNPDNLLARSYMGQAFVQVGALYEAREQLTEIRVRGGRQTWPEYALASAIRTGQGYSY